MDISDKNRTRLTDEKLPTGSGFKSFLHLREDNE